MRSLKRSVAFLLSFFIVMTFTPPVSAQVPVEGGGIYYYSPGSAGTIPDSGTAYSGETITESVILWNSKPEDTLDLPELEPIPAQINADTYVIQGETYPGAEVTAVGGPYDLPAVYADDDGHFEIEVALEQDAVTTYLVKIVQGNEFAPALSIHIVESSDAPTLEELTEKEEEVVDETIEEGMETVTPVLISEPVVSAPVIQVESFRDVPTSAWFNTPITKLRAKNIISGYGNNRFGPGDPVTRGQIMKIALNTIDLDTSKIEAKRTFSDVDTGNVFYPYVETAYKNGIVSGYADGRFGVNDPVNRAQSAKILVNTFDLDLISPPEPSFPDVPTDAWFFPYVETLKANGIVQGNPDGTFAPNRILNRAEISKMTVNLAESTPLGLANDFRPEDFSDEAWDNWTNTTLFTPEEKAGVAYLIFNPTPCPYGGASVENLVGLAVKLKEAIESMYSDDMSEEEKAKLDELMEAFEKLDDMLAELEETADEACSPSGFYGATSEIRKIIDALKEMEGVDEALIDTLDEVTKLLGELSDNTQVEVDGDRQHWSPVMIDVKEQVDSLLGREIVISTDCEEYNRKAAELADLQEKARARLADAIALKARSAAQLESAQADKTAADDALKAGEEAKTAADDAVKKEEDNILQLEKTIMNTLKDKGVQMGPMDSPPAGYQASFGANTGGFPLFGNNAVHMQGDASIEAFLDATEAWRDEIGAARDKWKAAKETQDEANAELRQAKANQRAAQAALRAAQAADSAAKRQVNEAEGVLASINALIRALNARYEECERKVEELKIAKEKAESAQDSAQSAIDSARRTRERSGNSSSKAGSSISAAEDALDSSKRAVSNGYYEEAERLAGVATGLAERAKREVRADDCIDDCKKKLSALEEALQDAKKETNNKRTDFSATETIIREAKRLIEKAEEALQNDDPERASRLCAQARRKISRGHRQISQDAQADLDAELEGLESDARDAQYDKDREELEGEALLELLKEYQEYIQAILDSLDETDAKVKKLLELAEKAGIKVDPKEGVGKTIARVLKLMKTAKEHGDTLNDGMKKLNEFLETEFNKYIREKLKDVLLELAEKLAARGLKLSGGPLTALTAVWGEAWDLGAAMGDWIVEQMMQIRQNIFIQEVAGNDLCSSPDATSQPNKSIPVKLSWYVQVIDESNPDELLEGATATCSTSYSNTGARTEYELESDEIVEDDLGNEWRIPTEAKVEKVMCDNAEGDEIQASVSRKYVSVKRYCEDDHIRVEIHIRIYVMGCG